MKCWIYFARHGCDGPIKIGRAHDPHKRVRDLSIGSPVALVLLGAMLSAQAEEEEDQIHELLRTSCIRGEWFIAEAVEQEMDRLAARILVPDAIVPEESSNDCFNANMNVRVTAAELTAWKLAAKASGMSLSQWARNVFNACAAESVSAENDADADAAAEAVS